MFDVDDRMDDSDNRAQDKHTVDEYHMDRVANFVPARESVRVERHKGDVNYETSLNSDYYLVKLQGLQYCFVLNSSPDKHLQ